MLPRSCRISVGVALFLALPIHTAQAVVILDSSWEAAGGSEGDWGAGFGPAVALANAPQFDPVIGFEGQFGDDRHFGCTGTWLGNNADGNAMVLSASHCFTDIDVNAWIYVTPAGSRLGALDVSLHPLYDAEDDATNGYDIALVELDGPIEDIDAPASLYAGSDELGYYAIAVGYGKRGTGDHGEDRKFNTDSEKAAASNMIDVVEEPSADGQDGNLLRSDFDHPDGGMNTLEGDEFPNDALEGMIAQGDSGGSLWIHTGDDWRVAGVNVTTDVMLGYGMIEDFARISTQLDWILSVFPDAETGE